MKENFDKQEEGFYLKGERITIKEMLKKYPNFSDKYYMPEDNKYVYYYGKDVVWKGDLNLDFEGENWPKQSDDIEGMVFNGDLIVEGTIRNMEMNYGPLLFVMGDCKAKNIDKSGSLFYFKKNVNVENVVYGYYNDGLMVVDGVLKADFLINDDHFFEIKSLDPSTITVNNYSDHGDFDYYREDLERAFVREVLHDGVIDINIFIERVNNNKRVMRPDAKRSIEIVQEKIEKLAQNEEGVAELDLEYKRLKEFPRKILKIKNLKKLYLGGNHIGNIPEEIDKLESLEELHLDFCKLKSLPESIGNLKNLRILKLDNNTGMCFPESIKNLTSLEELSMYQTSDDEPIEFPEWICQLTNLKRLFLGSNSFKSIPECFLNLKKLEELDLDRSLCYLNDLPDLSKLSNLKILQADGLRSYFSRPYPKQALIKHFFNITSLEELHIDRHGKIEETYKNEDFNKLKENLSHDPERFEEIKNKLTFVGGKWKGLLKKELKAEHLEGIENLKNLKILDLSFNGLKSLPADFYELRNLKKIDFTYCALSKEEREKLMKVFPETQIDFRNQKTEEKLSEDEDFLAMKEHLKKGNTLRSRDHLGAIEAYDKALEFYKSGKVTNEYNLIYLHYSKMWVYAQLGYRNSKDSEEKIWKYKKLGVEEAKTCLELVPSNFNIWHFTDEGQFHKETIIYACNTIAWYLYQNFNEVTHLEEALRVVERGVELVQEEMYYYIIDTKVRILLKLGRKDEAFPIVRRILEKSPDFGDFQDLKKDADFLNWIKASD
ncbi:MAG: hypothetical protein JW891_01420 [Candidatus Lokiarchaeota archaeon]|nr:hypothetical protein [Candidatus Lokiarchaeota archaeon]